MSSPAFEAIQPGLRGEVKLVVAEDHTVRHIGSGGVQVLATPQMILFMERAGVAAVDHLLPEDYRTVGAHLNVRQKAAGHRVTCPTALAVWHLGHVDDT